MSTTALILRPQSAPHIHVLECDGPRRKYAQRGEGYYYLSTSNHPSCDEMELRVSDGRRGCLHDWDQPCWNIYKNHDGSIEVHASRPTIQEAMRGDLHGRWSSIIRITSPTRQHLRLALHIARKLCKCNPTEGITLTFDCRPFFGPIETEIPVQLILSSSGIKNLFAA